MPAKLRTERGPRGAGDVARVVCCFTGHDPQPELVRTLRRVYPRVRTMWQAGGLSRN